MALTHPLTLLAVLVLLSLAGLWLPPASATDRTRYKLCKDNGFCRRNRAGSPTHTPSDYHLNPTTIATTATTFTASLLHGVWPRRDPLQVKLSVLHAGNTVRFQVDDPLNTVQKRFELPTGADGWVVTSEHTPADLAVRWAPTSNERFEGRWTANDDQAFHVAIEYQPFVMTFSVDSQVMQVINGRNLLSYEQYRQPNPRPPGGSTEMDPSTDKYPYDDPADDLWQETWRHKDLVYVDSKPKGSAAIGVDVTFNAMHVYGLAEHATNYSLVDTNANTSVSDASVHMYNEPFRLHNLDVYHYELDDPMALYGSIPLMLAHSVTAGTSGFFWHNAADTYIDISTVKQRDDGSSLGRSAHWLSESGSFDSYILLGPTAADVWHAYHTLTGFAPLPQQFDIAYHQSRWSYNDQADILDVVANFDKHDIPLDVIWIDIDHVANGYEYFTWNLTDYPDPLGMQQQLAEQGRMVVTIQDCHTKTSNPNYYVHQQATEHRFYVQQSAANLSKPSIASSAGQNPTDYTGICWPGNVSYLDYMMAATRKWWAALYQYSSYKYSTPTMFIWNDMNEPSQYAGPEKTIAKDALHMNRQVEHRDVHNVYGMLQMRATYEGLLQRDSKPQRAMVLSRSFHAGSHRYGAIWTGDNTATWGHLNNQQHMLLSLNTAGFSFVGADVGGFLGDPDDQAVLSTRWFAAAAFTPFMRGHAAFGTKRKDPYVFGEPYTTYLRNAVRTRYTLQPYIYTLFHQSHTEGLPVMRPLWSEFPSDEQVLDVGHMFMLGNALLVHPVVEPAATSTTLYLPHSRAATKQLWYTYDMHEVHTGGQQVTLDTPLERIPVFQRGGTIIVRKDTPRQSSSQMQTDPYTIVIALDAKGNAEGTVYVDDGKSFDYQTDNVYIHKRFRLDGGSLSGSLSARTESDTKGAGQAFDAPLGQIQIVGARSGMITDLKLHARGTVVASDQLRPVRHSGNVVTIDDLQGLHISDSWTMTWLTASHDEL